MRNLKKVGIGITFVTVVSLLLVGAARNSDTYFLIKKNFTIFSEVFREVSLNYVDEVDPQRLMRHGINSMLKTLDPYTVFIDEGQNEDIEIITRGSYGGVGLDVGVKGGEIVVIAPLEGYPAFQKGIRSGDVIKAVNGVSAEELSPEEVQNMMIGEPGTKARMTIRRYGVEQDLTFELERVRVEVRNITYHGLIGPENDIGYVLLSRFSQNAAEEVRDAIVELQSEQELRGLILDLRNNPGGLLGEAVGIVDKFIEPGLKVVETRGRLREHNTSFSTKEPPLLEDLPLTILQNSGSASASEIVAGALQDYDRGVIIGEQSFGKGLVQIVKPLSYNTALKITTSRYYIPSGRSIQSVTYSHDQDNIGVNRADSLQKAFTTRNGRTVYDGEGISPDIPVELNQPGLLETALLQNNHFFDFANIYASQHEEFNFEEVSPDIFSEFKKYLEEKDFEYETRAEQHLKKVKKGISDEVRSGKADMHIDALKDVINDEKKQVFEHQSEKLKKVLYLELISRYEGIKGQARASLKFDPMVEKALEILGSENRYKDILSGK